MEEANSSKKYDLKPSNVYGMSDCTYTKVNNNGGGKPPSSFLEPAGHHADIVLFTSGGVLNCPSGPKDLTCSVRMGSHVRHIGTDMLSYSTSMPQRSLGL